MGHAFARFCACCISCVAACHPGDPGTSRGSTTGDGIDPTTTTTGRADASTGGAAPTTGVPTTGPGPDPVGPCAGQSSDRACPCVGADDEFCNALDIFCRVEVHLDLGEMMPGTDYCDVIFAYCTSPGVSTFSACELLGSTCVQVAPTGDAADCDGARDACACDGFAWDHGTSTGAGEDTGDTEEHVISIT